MARAGENDHLKPAGRASLPLASGFAICLRYLESLELLPVLKFWRDHG
jgi:hypothetical protein